MYYMTNVLNTDSKLDEDVHEVLNMYYRRNKHIRPPQTSSKPVPAQCPHVAAECAPAKHPNVLAKHPCVPASHTPAECTPAKGPHGLANHSQALAEGSHGHVTNPGEDEDEDNTNDNSRKKPHAVRNSKSHGNAKPTQLGYYSGKWVEVLIMA